MVPTKPLEEAPVTLLTVAQRIPLSIALIAGGLAIAMEWIIGFALPPATPGLSLVHDYVSAAGADGAPYALTFQVMGAAAAALHLVLVLRLWPAWQAAPFGRAVIGLFAAFFAFIGISMAFRCDPHCAMTTLEAQVHNALGWIAFLNLGFAGIFSVVSHYKMPRPGSRVIAAIAAVMVVLAIGLLLSALTDVLRGATERATIIAMITWTGALVWQLLSGPAGQQRPSRRRRQG